MTAVDEETNSSFHDVGSGNYLKCEYHDQQWDGDSQREKRNSAKAFFLQLSPFAEDKPTTHAAYMAAEVNHASQVYCGGKKYIIDSIVYSKCPNHPRKFTSPYNYKTIGPSSLCFLKGKSLGGRHQGGGGGAGHHGGGGHGGGHQGGGGGAGHQGGGGGAGHQGGGGGAGHQGGGHGGAGHQGGGHGGGGHGGGGAGQGNGGGGHGAGGGQGGGGAGADNADDAKDNDDADDANDDADDANDDADDADDANDANDNDDADDANDNAGNDSDSDDEAKDNNQPPPRNRRNRRNVANVGGERQSQRLRDQRIALQNAPVRARAQSPPVRRASRIRRQGGRENSRGQSSRQNRQNSNSRGQSSRQNSNSRGQQSRQNSNVRDVRNMRNTRSNSIKHRLRKTERKNYKFGSNDSGQSVPSAPTPITPVAATVSIVSPQVSPLMKQSTPSTTPPTAMSQQSPGNQSSVINRMSPSTALSQQSSVINRMSPTTALSQQSPVNQSSVINRMSPTTALSQQSPVNQSSVNNRMSPTTALSQQSPSNSTSLLLSTQTQTQAAPLAAVFDLKTQTLPQISEPISTQVMQWDQVIQLTEMKSEWQKLLAKIGNNIQSQVYQPLQRFNVDKIIGKQVTSGAPEVNIECVKQTEFAIRAWMEKHRRRLFYKNGLNERDGFIEYTRAAFVECIDHITHLFQEEWTMKLDKCLYETKNVIKTNMVLKKRTVKPPMDTNEQHSQLTKIANIRGDPELLTKVQTDVYDRCIEQLTRELKSGVPFAQIQIQMNPVQTIEPYLNQLWEQTVKFYKSLEIQFLFLQTLEKLYEKIRPIWESIPVMFELVKVMDHSFRISQWSNFFANIPVTSARHFMIFNDVKTTLESYASHKIAVEKYIEIYFPLMLDTWAREDIQYITSDEHLTKITSQFQQLFEVYVSKFRDDLNNVENLSWLGRSLVLMQKQDVIN